MTGALRTVLLGAGKSGRLFAAALAPNPQVDLRVVVSGRGGSAAEIASEVGAESMVAGEDWSLIHPDLVVVATPHDQHEQQTLTALTAGASVLVDKPVVTTGDSWTRVFEASRTHGRVFCAFVQRCSPAVLTCREYLRARRPQITGMSIQQILARDATYYTTWKGNFAQSGGGVLMNQAIHALDLAQFVTSGQMTLNGALMWTPPEIDVETVVTATLTMDGAIPVILSATTSSAVNEQQLIRVCLGDEMVLLVGSEVVSWAGTTPAVAGSEDVESLIAALGRGGDRYGPGHRAAVDDVVTSILAQSDSIYELELSQVEETHRLVYEMYDFASSGRRS